MDQKEQQIINQALENENAFNEVFSSYFYIENNSEKIKRFYDDIVKDKYDNNFTLITSQMDENLYQKILKIKEERNENFVKITCQNPSRFLKEKGFEEEGVITMLKVDYLNFNIISNNIISFSSIKENPEHINGVIALEIEEYSEDYGVDFCIRQWNEYFDYVRNGKPDFNIHVVTYKNNVVGYCYAYHKFDVVCIDYLLVKKEFRKQYIASNLLAHIAKTYDCPVMLHASLDESAKEMYKKLGFKTIRTFYDYLKKDEKK